MLGYFGQEFGYTECAVVILPDEDDTPESRVEREATANLVAASPLLYEALEQQLAQWQLISNMVDTDNDEIVSATIEASMGMISRALRAARGEK